jgi:hypothetical protein
MSIAQRIWRWSLIFTAIVVVGFVSFQMLLSHLESKMETDISELISFLDRAMEKEGAVLIGGSQSCKFSISKYKANIERKYVNSSSGIDSAFLDSLQLNNWKINYHKNSNIVELNATIVSSQYSK